MSCKKTTNAPPQGTGSELTGQALSELQQDVEKNLRTVLQATLSKLDLVTREEFDVQARVLARTREKLDKLEKTITALEEQSNGSEDNPHADQTR